MNGFPAMLLRSPLHGLMSENTLLITFTGRKSGKAYTIPIVYLREGEAFLMTTDSPWWKNLRGGAPVTLRVKGEEHPAFGEAMTEEAEVKRVLESMLREHPGYGRHVGLKGGRVDRARIVEGRPGARRDPGQVRRAWKRVAMVQRPSRKEER
jgi:deazaflavin-dependent oxidoreductase (nitroreductase family)